MLSHITRTHTHTHAHARTHARTNHSLTYQRANQASRSVSAWSSSIATCRRPQAGAPEAAPSPFASRSAPQWSERPLPIVCNRISVKKITSERDKEQKNKQTKTNKHIPRAARLQYVHWCNIESDREWCRAHRSANAKQTHNIRTYAYKHTIPT